MAQVIVIVVWLQESSYHSVHLQNKYGENTHAPVHSLFDLPISRKFNR